MLDVRLETAVPAFAHDLLRADGANERVDILAIAWMGREDTGSRQSLVCLERADFIILDDN